MYNYILLYKSILSLSIIVFLASCSVPFRLQNKLKNSQNKSFKVLRSTAIAEKRIENVHLGSIQENVIKIVNAKIIIADYKLIKKDFPSMKNKSEPQIDKWLIGSVAFISKAQQNRESINTEIEILELTRKSFRPPGYNRGLVYKMNEPDTGEYRWENLVRDVLTAAKVSNKTIATYAIIDPGFDIIHEDGSTSRSDFYLRQAHHSINEHDQVRLPKDDRASLPSTFNSYNIDLIGI